jgi:hypothetical protein
VEVKAGYQPFATAAGQAHGYSVYADRCFLADVRDGGPPFDQKEIAIASALGIGLLAIRRGKVAQVLAAPQTRPIESLRLELLEKVGLSVCSLCRSLFTRGKESNWSAGISRAGIVKAAERDKGFVYWLYGQQKQRNDERTYVYQRRYLCRDCVSVLSKLKS